MGLRRFQINLLASCISAFLLIINSGQSKDNQDFKIPDEIKKLEKSRIVELTSTLMPDYPKEAYEAGIDAQVWVRFKVDALKTPYSVEVIYCSVDSFGFQAAADSWLRSEKIELNSKVKNPEEGFWYAKLDYLIEKWDWHLYKGGGPISQSTEATEHDQANNQSEFTPVEIMPEMVSKAKAKFPERAKELGKAAKVDVRVLLSETGEVIRVIISRTSDPNWFWGINETAIECARKCKFKPAVMNGKPIKVWVSFPIEFTLH